MSEEVQPEYVTYRVEDGVAWVMLNRPQYSNAQNYRLLGQLDDAFKRAVEDDDVKVIVLGGEGKHFSAGHDIGTPEKDSNMPRFRTTLWWDHLNKGGAERQYVLEQDGYLGLCRRWQEIPKPMIAMVQGACIAGGLMLAWVCDLIVASEDAFFQDPVQRMAQPGVEYFAHAFELPPRVARELLLLGRRMPAQRAYQFGMVNEIFPREALREEVAKIAAEIAQHDRFGMALTKQAFNFVEDLRGKRQAMDGVFHMHHLAHAHNQLMTGNLVGGLDAKAMATANKKQAGEG
ncbi:enoyl-CoA hydratase [Sphingobium sp. 22B]|uniref:enoyl-CoA hydratase n=1 Tax=unclassified Sphingobium TaxID=2611147 RepID=UPI000784DECB|nr:MULTISPECIES: enoyl-CoA hydratase [unclassified Sphingobium]KXU32072.1 enoyl-CoA hydratase [Sphingobium sp. AM]KYC31827.1 enoyl-CoA hydratase [Sphingobium sp. 22B]OAP31350.1 enoyl-CoA hydratase [Sphingobium sp. 20006FA]